MHRPSAACYGCRAVLMYRCCLLNTHRLTGSHNIHELGPGIDHGTVLSHHQALSAVKAVLTQMLGLNQPQQSEADGDEDGKEDGADEEGAAKGTIHIGGRPTELVSVSNHIVLPGGAETERKIEG